MRLSSPPCHPAQVVEKPHSGAAAAKPASLEAIAAEFEGRQHVQERVQLLLEYAKRLPPMPAAAKTDANRVMGCTAQVAASSETVLASSAVHRMPTSHAHPMSALAGCSPAYAALCRIFCNGFDVMSTGRGGAPSLLTRSPAHCAVGVAAAGVGGCAAGRGGAGAAVGGLRLSSDPGTGGGASGGALRAETRRAAGCAGAHDLQAIGLCDSLVFPDLYEQMFSCKHGRLQEQHSKQMSLLLHCIVTVPTSILCRISFAASYMKYMWNSYHMNIYT